MKLTEEDRRALKVLIEENRKTIEELFEMGVVLLIIVIGILVAVGTVSGVIPEMVTVVACVTCLAMPFVAGFAFIVCGVLVVFWKWVWNLLRPLVQRRHLQDR